MEVITINSEQVIQLIKNEYLEIAQNNRIEFVNNNLVLNCNGEISNVRSINILFEKLEIKNKHIIDYIQNIICEHLNLELNEVIYSSGCADEFDFKIRFAPNIEWQIVVCEYSRALQNMCFISDEQINVKPGAPAIGIYKRLGKSAYYFRWFERI
ncbi:hypothetical protein J6E39_04630 [bacterium]|nr:hypothetical protein [bacterium]